MQTHIYTYVKKNHINSLRKTRNWLTSNHTLTPPLPVPKRNGMCKFSKLLPPPPKPCACNDLKPNLHAPLQNLPLHPKQMTKYSKSFFYSTPLLTATLLMNNRVPQRPRRNPQQLLLPPPQLPLQQRPHHAAFSSIMTMKAATRFCTRRTNARQINTIMRKFL